MTECERLINKGFIGRGFFEEEVRCEYTISTQMKKAWAIEMDLYEELERVCKKHNLRFFAIGGTLLGAIRHNGFIPWDDDMDIVMPREDYEKLCKLYHNEFHSPYFLQTPDTDPGYYFSFAKLRNSNTTCISMPFRNSLFNQGIDIDIFPLDYIDISNAEGKNKAIRESIMKCSSYMKIGSEEYLNERQMANFNKYNTNNPRQEYDNIQLLAQSFGKTDYLGINVCTIYPFLRLSWPAHCFEEVEDHRFEHISVAIPKGWHEILSICFGNYMQFPPVEVRGTWHPGEFWDADLPYTDFLLPNREGWNLLKIGKYPNCL